MALVTRDTLFNAAIRGLVWRAEHRWEPAAAAVLYFGFTVPEVAMVALGRDYYVGSDGIKVDLYETAFTGGQAVATINRDLRLRAATPPVQFFQGVTPAATTDRITGFEQTIQGGGSRIGLRGDLQPFVHERLKSYVVGVQNTGNGTGVFSFAVDFRLKYPGEAD